MVDRHPEGLHQFLVSLEDFTPTVPDEVTQHHLALGGFKCEDPQLVRLVAVAAQKFAADVLADAMQSYARRLKQPVARLKEQGYSTKPRAPVLTFEDLAEALQEARCFPLYGLNLARPPYLASELAERLKEAKAAQLRQPAG